MILILAEKPSVGRALSSVVGANKTNKGYIEGSAKYIQQDRKAAFNDN